MKLNELLKNTEYDKIKINRDLEITSLCIKAEECKPGSAFFCIKGNKYNGGEFVNKAIKLGAVVIISENDVDNCTVAQIRVKNVRDALSAFCKNFYGNPQKKLRKIAVVGTNGKTSVCEMISYLFNKSGIKCGTIGTLGAKYSNIEQETGFTTPDTPILYKILADMVTCGVKVVCMELSAHAIYYRKANFKFDITVLTNCTPEHLDFFEDFENYYATKINAFTAKNTKICVVNGDTLMGQEISCLRKAGVIAYGIDDPVDVFAVDFIQDSNGCEFVMNLFDSIYNIKNKFVGKYNVYNMLASATVCALCGVKTDFIAQGLNEMPLVSGRMQQVCDSINVFVDYAHTPDALEQSLSTLREIKGEKRLICVFGCGGNRDRSKRALMGEISAKLADFTVITSDNPRFEDENDIISQIESGTRKITSEYITIRDRSQAIEYAVQRSNKGDYILIAGKGSENYQEIMGTRKHFSDEENAKKWIRNKYDRL